MLKSLEHHLGHPDPQHAWLSRGLLIGVAVLFAALWIGVLGPLLALIGVGALVVGYALLRDVRAGLVAVIAVAYVLPFATFPFDVGVTPTFLNAVVGAVFFVYVLRVATRREQRLEVAAVGVVLAIFILWMLVTFSLGIIHSRPTPTILRHFLELLLALTMYYVVLNAVKRREDLIFFTRILILAGTLSAAIAILFYLLPVQTTVRILNALARLGYPGGFGALRWIEDNPNNPMRAIGTAVDPNVLGGMMILVGGLTGPQLASPRPVFPRWALVGMYVLQLVALFLTFSRGAMLGFMAALGVLAVLKYPRLLLFMGLGGAILLLLPWSHAYIQHFIEGLQGKDLATKMRFGEYKDAFRLIRRYPWTGVGFTGSPDIDLYVGVSSVYLLVAEQTGIIGLGLYLLTLAVFLLLLWRRWRKGMPDAQLESILLGYGGALVGVMVSGVFDHYLFNMVYPHMATLFWLYIGLGVATSRLIDREDK
ncbi:MAG: hypothetical protein GXO55_04385 [Chloroflexi bacterium]|nr:hypothetical protein [Chloroflexota bacterium]